MVREKKKQKYTTYLVFCICTTSSVARRSPSSSSILLLLLQRSSNIHYIQVVWWTNNRSDSQCKFNTTPAARADDKMNRLMMTEEAKSKSPPLKFDFVGSKNFLLQQPKAVCCLEGSSEPAYNDFFLRLWQRWKLSCVTAWRWRHREERRREDPPLYCYHPSLSDFEAAS